MKASGLNLAELPRLIYQSYLSELGAAPVAGKFVRPQLGEGAFKKGREKRGLEEAWVGGLDPQQLAATLFYYQRDKGIANWYPGLDVTERLGLAPRLEGALWGDKSFYNLAGGEGGVQGQLAVAGFPEPYDPLSFVNYMTGGEQKTPVHTKDTLGALKINKNAEFRAMNAALGLAEENGGPVIAKMLGKLKSVRDEKEKRRKRHSGIQESSHAVRRSLNQGTCVD